MADNMPTKIKSGKAVGAMLGAACGDALGWPNERIGKSKISKQPQGSLHEFRKWSRRSGGRFFPHEEVIEAGEYSDDTQLILCLSRSLLKGSKWWDYFTQVELPFWSAYERGGGGATKRTVDSWLDGVAPWTQNRKPQYVKRYFNAGGNGVAMRALPHVLHLGGKEFSEVASSIFLDGITTHGHPRALLGALVYGFALWIALRKDSKLGYGELVEELIAHESTWSIIPSHEKVGPKWLKQAEKHLKDYSKIWSSAKDEILQYLSVCHTELSKGALSFDDDALEKLQCFNKKISGAGTVAAISSVYIASRYAADPINGVIKAAFAIGSDTDTIASMAGGLLGCINGSDWLSSVKNGIQDSIYIEKTALCLGKNKSNDDLSFKPVKRSALKNWIDNVVTIPDSSEISLPDGRKAKVKCGQDQIGRSGKYKVEFRKFITAEGQTLYINKISKGNFASPPPSSNVPTREITPNKMQQSQYPERLNLGPKLPVASIEKSIWFYKEMLGLTIKKQSKDVVVFAQGLVLAPATYIKEFQVNGFRTLMYVEVTDIQNRYNWIVDRNIQVVTKLECWGQSKRRYFRCFDPDGNLVEVFEKQ